MGREQCTEMLVSCKDLIWVCCVRPGLAHLRRVSWLHEIRNPRHRECMVPTALVAALDKALRDVAGPVNRLLGGWEMLPSPMR